MVDSFENESALCTDCLNAPQINSYLNPGGQQRFRLRYECDLQSSTTKLFDEDGNIVGICVVDSLNNNCESGNEFTGYTFGQNITTIWTCEMGFSCSSAPRELLFPDYQVEIQDDPCISGLKRLSVSETFNAYLWLGPDGTMSSDAELDVFISGNYQLIVFQENGCTDSSMIVVNTFEASGPVIIGPTVLCKGEEVNLSIGNYASYKWSNGATDAVITITEPGFYEVIVTNAAGCQDNDFQDNT